MREQTDHEHMQRLAQGDLAHLEPLYQRWRQRVAALCYGMVGDTHTAADLCHDVFLRVVLYARSFRGDSSFGTWLYTTARRVCLDHLSRNKRGRTAMETLKRETPRSAQTTPEVQRLRTAFERLPAEQRELLVLHRFHGWKLREIAEHLGSTEGAIKVRAHRAIKALRDAYQQVEDEHDA